MTLNFFVHCITQEMNCPAQVHLRHLSQGQDC